MKKIMGIIAILMFAFATAAFADGIKCDSVNDADEYFTHGEKIIAWDCIEQVIKTKPNAKAHFTKGKFALQNGDLATAKMKFSADDVRAKYGEEIFQLYKTVAERSLGQGNFTFASDMFTEALAYKPSVRQSIANEMFEAGKKSSNPRGYFTVAIRLDASMAQKTAQIWNGLSQQASNEDSKIGMLREAAQDDPARFKHVYDDSAKNAGMRHLTAAKKYAKQFDMKTGKGMDAETAREKALAIRFFKGTPSEGLVEKELPEVVEYTTRPEPYSFSLKAGEQTNHWLKIEGFDVGFASEKECQYERLGDDGYVAKKGEKRSLNKTIVFKLRAITDCTRNGGIDVKVK